MIIIKYKKKKKKRKRSPLLYKDVGSALDDNPECKYIVIVTLYEDDIYVGPIACMPEFLRQRPVIRGDIDGQTLILLT